LMVGLCELLYQRSLPLAARGLIVETARAEPETCVLLGAARVVVETQLRAEHADQTIRRLWASAANDKSAEPLAWSVNPEGLE
jgi:hypothetical protein